MLRRVGKDAIGRDCLIHAPAINNALAIQEPKERPRALFPSDSASLEEFSQDLSKGFRDSPASMHMLPDPKEVPEKLQLGSISGGSHDKPPSGIKQVDSWHISTDRDGRGMHVTFQVCPEPFACGPLSGARLQLSQRSARGRMHKESACRNALAVRVFEAD